MASVGAFRKGKSRIPLLLFHLFLYDDIPIRENFYEDKESRTLWIESTGEG